MRPTKRGWPAGWLAVIMLVTTVLSVLPGARAQANPYPNLWAAIQAGVDNAARSGVEQYVMVMDRDDGAELAWTSNAWTQVASESLVKLNIAAYWLHATGGNAGAAPCDLWAMVAASNDQAATNCWRNDIMWWTSGMYGLSGSNNNWSDPSYWGATPVTAADLARLVYGTLRDPVTGGWLGSAMLNATDIAADGYNQNFGMNRIAGAGSKQGWGLDSYWRGPIAIHSVGFNDYVTVAILQTGPNWTWGTMPATATYTAQLINDATSTNAAPGHIRDAWSATGGEMGRAISPRICDQPDGWCRQDFIEGVIFERPGGPAYQMIGQIGLNWHWSGRSSGPWGWMTSNVVGIRDGWKYQNYAGRGGSAMLLAPWGAVYESYGPSRTKWGSLGWENGALGYPQGNLQPLAGGWSYQAYERGAIYLNPEGGAVASYGATHAAWRARGLEHGAWGFPASDPIRDPNGWVVQEFEGMGGSALLAAPRGPVFESYGPIRQAWLASGSAGGPLGYPQTNVIGLPSGWSYQAYESGAIYLRSDGLALATHGVIHRAWVGAGLEHGALGWPTGQLSCTDGVCRQDFEGGVITAVGDQATITYRSLPAVDAAAQPAEPLPSTNPEEPESPEVPTTPDSSNAPQPSQPAGTPSAPAATSAPVPPTSAEAGEPGSVETEMAPDGSTDPGPSSAVEPTPMRTP